MNFIQRIRTDHFAQRAFMLAILILLGLLAVATISLGSLFEGNALIREALTIGGSLAVLLIAFAFYFLNHHIGEYRRAKEELQQLNHELEQRVTERTAALTVSEHNFRDLADSALVGIYRSSLQGEILYVNQTLAQIMGFDSPAAMMGNGALARYRDPAERQAFLEKLQHDGKVEAYELVVLNKSGQPLHALVSARIDGDQLTGTFLDITERKRAEEQLRDSEVRFRGAFDLSPIGMTLTAPDGRWLEVNRAFCQIVGYSEEELLTQTFQEITHPADLDADLASMRQLLAGAIPTYQMEKRYLRKTGQMVWVLLSVSLMRDAQEQPLYFLAQIQEITERKRVEEALRQSSEKVRSIFGAIADGITVADFQGQIIESNDAAAKMHGFENKAEFLNARISQLVAEADRARLLEDGQRIVQNGGAGVFEYRLRRKDGTLFAGELRLTTLNDAEKRPTALIAVTRDISERKRAEEALYLSNQNLATIIHASPLGIISYDLNGYIRSWNPAAGEIFGWDESEVLGRLAPHIGAAHLPEFHALRQRVVRGEALRAVELRRQKKDGTQIVISLNTAPTYAPSGQLDGYIAIIEEITERKQVEQQMQALIESMPDGVLVVNSEGRIVVANAQSETLFGYPRQELLGQPIEMLLPERVRAIHPQHRNGYLTAPKTRTMGSGLELYARRKDGSEFPVDISLSAVESGRGHTAIAVIRDITERKRVEESLRESDLRTRLATEATEVGIWEWNLITNRIRWDDQMFRLYGIAPTADGITDYSSWVNAVVAEDLPQQEAILQDTIRRGGQSTREFRIRRRSDGEERILQAVETVRLNLSGQTEWMVGTNRDITETRRAEQEIRKLNTELEDRVTERTAQLSAARNEAERANLAKSEFLSRMSHELRTPMNSILGFAQLLEMDELAPDQSQGVKLILKSGRHLLGLINEVLDIARVEAGHISILPEAVALEEALQSAVDLIRPLADKRGIAIEMTIPSLGGIFVTADSQRLKQVLLNLLSNAVKYNRENGSIHLSASLLVDGFLHLAVRDTGYGIPPEKMARLFIAFDRLGLDPELVEGTGLGLALSKGLMEAMGGRIGAQSVVGEGSAFWVDLQLTTQQREEIVMAEVDEYLKTNPMQKKGRILYVEDNLSNIQLIEKILARLPNVELISAMQGSLALDLARLHQPALILLDMHLPDMNGDQVLKQLRGAAETREIGVVMMSADAMPHQIERMLAAGANAYLTKPIDVREFLRVVGGMLAEGNPK